jgi:hypothetical protein
MLKVKLWFRISDKGRDRIREFQKENQPDWLSPDDKTSKSVPAVTVHYDHAEDVDKIMQATPAEVKHGALGG